MSTATRTRSCPGCGHTEFTRDLQASAGDLMCQSCGMVQEENPIVSEVQFGESSSGAAMVQGAMVGADQTRAFSMRNSLESREQTMLSAKHRIQKIAHAMRIPDYIVESASGWFKLALAQNFVQGRRSQNVIAACLYVACRHEKTHHLLIDFSSRLQISVYSLGATYLKLVRALHIQRLPPADPSLFIQHFAERLSFGEHTAKVCRDATKIAHRMASDWIYEGRRPAGIAGACLLLAARMNNFRRSHAEIVAVARVGEETLQKRLNEFKKTTSGKLSIQKFRESESTNDAMPPSFNQNRNIEAKIRKLMQQREETLKRYKQLAKEKQLFEALHIVPKAVEDVADGETTNTESSIAEKSTSRRRKTDALRKKIVEDDASELDSSEDEDEEQFVDADGDAAKNSAGSEEQVADDDNEVVEAETNATETNGDDDAELDEDAESDVEEVNEDEEVDVNALFIPSSDEEDEFGYDNLPDESNADEDYEQRHQTLFSSRPERQLRSSGMDGNFSRSLNRLEGMASSRLDTFDSIDRLRPKVRDVRRKSEKTKRKEEERSAKHDALLKSVLDGATLREEDLEIALDKILEGHRKSLDSSLYRTPAESENDVDLAQQIDLDRPKNLVKNCPTTAEVLAKVRDDVEVDDLDDDEEVLSIALGPDEIKQKEQIWIALNHEFLIAQEKKRLKMEADELTGNTSGRPRKRRRVKEQKDPLLDDAAVANAIRLIGEDGRTITPAESAKQMLQRKLFSRKINYDSIGDLFKNDN